MVLGIEREAADKRLKDLTAYLSELDAAKHSAVRLGLEPHTAGLDAMIRDAQLACQDAQETIAAYDQQEAERAATRLRAQAAQRMEQLILAPGEF